MKINQDIPGTSYLFGSHFSKGMKTQASLQSAYGLHWYSRAGLRQSRRPFPVKATGWTRLHSLDSQDAECWCSNFETEGLASTPAGCTGLKLHDARCRLRPSRELKRPGRPKPCRLVWPQALPFQSANSLAATGKSSDTWTRARRRIIAARVTQSKMLRCMTSMDYM